MAKIYNIGYERCCATSNPRTYFKKGTLEELINYFSYTLEKGASWQWDKGMKRVSLNPKTIKGLITALNNAVYNTQGRCYNQDYYWLEA